MNKEINYQNIPDFHKNLISEQDYNNLINLLVENPQIKFCISTNEDKAVIWFTILKESENKEIHFEIHPYDSNNDLQVIQNQFINDGPNNIYMTNYVDAIELLINFIK